MNVGDAVRFIGFRAYAFQDSKVSGVGIIVEMHLDSAGEKRCDVVWPDGTHGKWLYSESLEIVNG